MREERDRGNHLTFSEEELAFSDALGVNDRAVKLAKADNAEDEVEQYLHTVCT